MVKMNYLGPSASCSMILKRAFVDLHREKQALRPGGPQAARIAGLMDEIDAVHLDLFKRPAREPAGFHVCGVMQTRRETPDPKTGG